MNSPLEILRIEELHSGYGEIEILSGASLSIQAGQLTALVGANGVGKTTLLRTVVGLLHAKQGHIRFSGEDVSSLSAHAKAERGLILVPEGRQLFTTMSVVENLEMGATPKHAQKKKVANLEKIFELFPRLKERCNQRAGTLSCGEQQMLAIARGIMSEPMLFMIDEMSLGLSPVMALQLFDILLQLKKTGLSILLVEQNVQMALSICDYAFVLSQGRIDLQGSSQELLDNDRVKTTYLGIASSE